ncbi:hypothetical protein HF521_013367 [Silurus meridionalis]|uniref:Uncharacterized protein n=1 Tax=Silurus meridionalis TaxID=175797 RepID=A0A8T0AC18_SILME|nr:hypothetical protein HF521_013367 [Silurus meridionalis]
MTCDFTNQPLARLFRRRDFFFARCTKVTEAGIQINEEEARKFREKDVDGETVDCGLTEAMVGYLFDGSFKKQLKFQQFVRHYKENETIVVLEPVPVEVAQSTAELQPHPSTDPSVEAAHRGLPIVTVIPTFPKDVQARLDIKEPCHTVPKVRNKIIRTLYEMMAEYTLYPTNAEYIQVAKALIVKYPFLRDKEGNGYFFDEIDRIHPSPSSFCHRFREGFARVLPNVLKLATAKSPLAKQYTETRQDALAEDLPGIDLRAGLIFLPSIFREKIEHYITMKEEDPATPFPTIQLMENDWKMAIIRRGHSVVKVNGMVVCQCTSLDEAFMTAFCRNQDRDWVGESFQDLINWTPVRHRESLCFVLRQSVGLDETSCCHDSLENWLCDSEQHFRVTHLRQVEVGRAPGCICGAGRNTSEGLLSHLKR